MNKKVATIISRVCEPMVFLTVIAVVGGLRAGLSASNFFQYLMFLACFMVAPVLGLWMWFIKKEKISWDIPDRAKRVRPLLLVLGLMVINGLLTVYLRIPSLTQMLLLFIMWLVGFTAITTKWKISGHTGVAALAIGLILQWYGLAWWPILLIVPIIGWARVVRRDHTILQVIAGALYSWVLIFLFH